MKVSFEISRSKCVSAEMFPPAVGIVERFGVSTVTIVTIAVFWDETYLVDFCQRFGGTCCLGRRGRRSTRAGEERCYM
jgi:hypothetical protein